MNPAEDARSVKATARTLGFDACAIADAAGEADDGFDAWLAAGFHADIDWLTRTRDLRQQVTAFLPGARSVVVLACNYYAPRPAAAPDSGRVARYAWGRDYHRVLHKPLKQLAAFLDSLAPGAQSKMCIDSGPVRERAWAARAGLGWVGKNSLVIRQDMGSWFFLAAVVTTVELAPDAPAPDRCGACTACMDACPTGAIVAPRTVDSRRCLAYHTIENRGAFPPDIEAALGDRVFGCDACQEACPWNRFAKLTDETDFHPRPGHADLPLAPLLAADAAWFEEHTPGTPLRRAGLAGLQRNAAAVLKNRDRKDAWDK